MGRWLIRKSGIKANKRLYKCVSMRICMKLLLQKQKLY